MISKAKTHKSKRLKSLLLAILFTVSLLPPVEVRAYTGTGTQENPYIFTAADGAVVLTEEFSGTNVIIENGVFSVTVKDAIDVNIIFDNVTIDRRARTDTASGGMSGKQVPGLYAAAQKLGWGNKAPVCPFLVTGNSTVTVGFRGTCTFYAGTNSSTVNDNNVYTAYYVTNNNNHDNKGCGYAGIQVDKDATLTIQYAEKLTVYGAHQLDSPDKDGKVSNGMLYSDVLRANASISAAGYVNPYGTELYNVLNSHQQFVQSGGAGIGGGAAYDTTSSATADYTQGTPGTIIINGGNIEAFGGYAAAGIGGSVNGAATSTSITINGGNVIAHGGRFAAGIGDGDSVPNENSTGMSEALVESTGRIEINGGTVTSYGGVAAPGIGSSDDICESSKGHGADARSQLEIAINGGAVNAFSGFPSGFSGSYNDNAEAPAAIGAGAISQMESNSIYISSAADLLCAGFGNYSLTEIGTDGTASPTINVDSDGYLLLLRTGSYYANGKRVLKLWKPQTEEIPGVGTCTIYTVQSTGAIYYCCNDEDGNRLVYQKNGENYVRITEEVKNLTLYVNQDPEKGPVSEPLTDENGKQLQIELAYFFRSMAITLPEPEKHGGLYAITVPMDGVSNSNEKPIHGADIILTVEAYQQGTQSGTIAYPSDHNMNLDDTAERLTDLDVFTDNSIQLPADGLIGGAFTPGVFAYTVYVEPEVDEVTLRAAFKWETGVSYTLTLDGDPLDPTGQGNTREVSSVIDLAGVQTKTVRLKKIDGGDTRGAIVYKVTVIKKSEYTLQLSAPSKVYDGNPAIAAATGAGRDVDVGVLTETTTAGSVNEWVKVPESTAYTGSTVYINQSQYGYPTTYIANLDMTLSILPVANENAVQYILTVTTSQNSNSRTLTNIGTRSAGWKVAYSGFNNTTRTITRLADEPTGTTLDFGTWLGSETPQTIATGNGTDLNLVLNTNTTGANPSASAQLRLGSTEAFATIFSIGSAATFPEHTVVVNSAVQQAAANQAIKAGATQGTFPYGSYKESGMQQNLTIQKVTRSGNGNSLSSEISAPFTVLSSKSYDKAWIIDKETRFISVSVPEEDLEQATLTYYQTHAADGTTPITEIPLGTTPPTDAGTYRVEAELRTETYNAFGNRSFTISRREVRVQQIANWLLYVEDTPDPAPLPITDPGAILLENVVGGDDVSLSVDYKNGNVYYKETSLSYAPDKIALKNAVLTGPEGDFKYQNYILYYDKADEFLIFVFGQISLDVEGSTFRKTQDGEWRKYYPQSAKNPVGTAGNTPDYHSPIVGGVYRAHAEYIRARTVNHDAGARYAVDIEYGAMQFGFYHGRWDVSTLSVVKEDISFWGGMDGQNNRIILTNYSNAEILYQVAASIDFLYAAQGNSSTGITARIAADPGGNQTIEKTTWTSVAAATPGDSGNTGSSGSGECYLFLSGVPQMQESSTYIEVGTIKVTIAPAGGS